MSLIISIMLIFGACNYEPTGVYKSDIKMNTKFPSVKISLATQGDTILIYRSQLLRLSFETDTNAFIEGQFEIDELGSFKGEVDSNKKIVTFFFNSEMIKGNFAKLTANFVFESNSKSLADKLTNRKIYLKKFLVLKILSFEDFSCEITNVAIREGELIVGWRSDVYPDIVDSIKLVKSTPFGDICIKSLNYLPVENEFTDETYLGENATYKIFISLRIGLRRSMIESFFFDFYYDRPIIRYQKEGKKVRFYWPKSELKNVAGYTLRDKEKILWSGKDGDTSALIDDYIFAGEKEYFLNPVPAKVFAEYESHRDKGDYYSTVTLIHGENSSFPKGEIYPTSTGIIAFYKDYRVNYFSVTEEKIEESFPYYTCQYFIFTRTGSVAVGFVRTYPYPIIIRSGSLINKYSYQIDYAHKYSSNEISVSEDARFFCINGRYFTIYDFKGDSLIYHGDVQGDTTNGLRISPSGETIGINFTNNTFGIFKLNYYWLDTLMKGDGKVFGFSDDRYVVLSKPNLLQVLDINNNFNLVYEMKFQGEIKSIDFTGPNILIYDSGKLKALNYLTGRTYYEIYAADLQYILHRNIIYSLNGFMDRMN